MFIQGNLQAVFDALYSMGIIDPVLKMDWQEIHAEMSKDRLKLNLALQAINSCGGHIPALVQTMRGLDQNVVNFVALEVARELAEYTERKMVH